MILEDMMNTEDMVTTEEKKTQINVKPIEIIGDKE